MNRKKNMFHACNTLNPKTMAPACPKPQNPEPSNPEPSSPVLRSAVPRVSLPRTASRPTRAEKKTPHQSLKHLPWAEPSNMKLAGVSPGCTLALTKMARRSGKIQGRWDSYSKHVACKLNAARLRCRFGWQGYQKSAERR